MCLYRRRNRCEAVEEVQSCRHSGFFAQHSSFLSPFLDTFLYFLPSCSFVLGFLCYQSFTLLLITFKIGRKKPPCAYLNGCSKWPTSLSEHFTPPIFFLSSWKFLVMYSNGPSRKAEASSFLLPSLCFFLSLFFLLFLFQLALSSCSKEGACRI